MKSTQHGLTEIDMGILHGETLQAGSNNNEYREFLSQLEARAFWTRASKGETGDTLPVWMVQLGIGCAILSTCWVGGQLCYKGFQTTQGSEDNPELVRFCAASWRRCPVLRREQRKRELGDQWEELDDSIQQEVDSGEERDAWADESAE